MTEREAGVIDRCEKMARLGGLPPSRRQLLKVCRIARRLDAESERRAAFMREAAAWLRAQAWAHKAADLADRLEGKA